MDYKKIIKKIRKLSKKEIMLNNFKNIDFSLNNIFFSDILDFIIFSSINAKRQKKVKFNKKIS